MLANHLHETTKQQKNNKQQNNILSSQTEQGICWETHNKTNQYSHGISSVKTSYQNNNHG